MESLTLGACVQGAWLDAFSFIRRNPTIVIVMFAAWIVSMVFTTWLAQPPFIPISAWHLLRAVTTIVRSAVIVVLSMRVMQWAVLGDREAGSIPMFGKAFWRYSGLAIVIALSFIVVALLVFVGRWLLSRFAVIGGVGNSLPITLQVVVTVGLVGFLWARVSLLFCHAAIGRRGRWRASWNDTRGRAWQIVLARFLVGLPVVIGVIGLVLLTWLQRDMLSTTWRYLIPVVICGLSSVGLVADATCSSLLYRQFAKELVDRT